MKNKIIIFSVFIIAIIIGVLGYKLNTVNNLFSFNIIELLTLAIASILLYYLTEKNTNRRKCDDKIENLIVKIISKLSTICLKTPNIGMHSEYLYCFKYISNKFEVLDKLAYKSCKEHVTNGKNEFDKLRDFITDNINQNEKYFEDKKDKIPNLVSNIESNLDKIIVEIYDKK